MDIALYVLGGLAIGVGIGYGFTRIQASRSEAAGRSAAANIMAEAESLARETVLAAKDAALETRRLAEEETGRLRRDLAQEQEKLANRREKLDERFDQAENRARDLDERERQLAARDRDTREAETKIRSELERVAQLTSDQAREVVLAQVREEARIDAARIIRETESSAREAGEERAREIVVGCIQRCATDIVGDIVSSAVALPSDEMKGRIIGRQGRNIRAFEQITGVDVIVDDTPEAVTLSCFDPVRREIGHMALTSLIEDGRIHPARIEQVVAKTRENMDRTILAAGEEAAFDAGVPGLHKELMRLLGRLKYRTSYGQNVLRHSVETAHLAAMLASEVGADVGIARAGGLLHDIGKAVSHEVEGPHALIGADLAAKYGSGTRVVNAIAAHHHEVEPETIEALLVESADAISGARPGARRESLELYIKRIKALENIAASFVGVQESFAIQAGREVRIIVRPDEVDDLSAMKLSRDIARKVEESLEYPGQVKVTVIREMRAVDYAK